MLAGAGGQKVSDPDIFADDRGIRCGLDCDHFIIGKRYPLSIIALVELYAGVDGSPPA